MCTAVVRPLLKADVMSANHETAHLPEPAALLRATDWAALGHALIVLVASADL